MFFLNHQEGMVSVGIVASPHILYDHDVTTLGSRGHAGCRILWLPNDEAQRSPRSGDPLQRLVRRFIHSALIIPKYAIKDGTR